MTFSIAGRCPRTGMLGAVVTTSSMAVGSGCAWAEGNVGAVLTQHRTDPRLGPKILERLKHGSSSEAIIHDLEKTDPDLRWRQLAVIAADGKGAVFNGTKITSIVKAKTGRNCAAAGNILRNTAVVDAMISTFEENENQSLAERLMRAIEARQAAGGELKQADRGKLRHFRPCREGQVPLACRRGADQPLRIGSRQLPRLLPDLRLAGSRPGALSRDDERAGGPARG